MATSITGQGIAAYKAPDDALSSESKNAVQNKVIDEELSDVKNAISQLGDIAAFKTAILQLAQKVAYIDEHGQNCYDALEAALYPQAGLDYIEAVYTQTGIVYNTDTLDSLKGNLVVTAYYDDETSEIVTNYTLSGTLTAGTSTITVSYGGKTTTFNVTVTELALNTIERTFGDATYNMTYVSGSEYSASITNGSSQYSGSIFKTSGDELITSATLEIENANANNQLLIVGYNADNGSVLAIFINMKYSATNIGFTFTSTGTSTGVNVSGDVGALQSKLLTVSTNGNNIELSIADVGTKVFTNAVTNGFTPALGLGTCTTQIGFGSVGITF